MCLYAINSFVVADGSESIEKPVLIKERFKNWYEMAYKPLKDSNEGLIDLNLPKHATDRPDIALSQQQQVSLHDIINWNIAAICSKNFDEYHKLITKIAKGNLKINATGYDKMQYWLKNGDAIRRPESLTNYELLEAYWMLCSRAGYSNTHFIGLIVNESFYQLKLIENYSELKSFPDPFPEDRKSCGQILQTSSFIFCDSDPLIEFECKRKILVADIKYMLKTNIKDLAYPICIRAYWNERLTEWIPWFCIEYNAPERHCRVVF